MCDCGARDSEPRGHVIALDCAARIDVRNHAAQASVVVVGARTVESEANPRLQARCSILVDGVCLRMGIALLPLERRHLMGVVLDFPGRWRTAAEEELHAAITAADLSTKECDLLCVWMDRNPEMFRGVVVLRLILGFLKNPIERTDLVQHVYMRVGQVAYMLNAGARAAG